jgi:hypothetical protein
VKLRGVTREKLALQESMYLHGFRRQLLGVNDVHRSPRPVHLDFFFYLRDGDRSEASLLQGHIQDG